MSDHRLMPVEPDVGMVGAGARVLRRLPGAEKLATQVYRSMCAAAPAVQGEPVAFCEDAALSIAERTFSTDVDEQLASDIIQYAQRLHSLYAAPQPAEQQSAQDVDSYQICETHQPISTPCCHVCLMQDRDRHREGRLAALERAAKAESDVAWLVEALEDIAKLPIDPCSTENDYRLSGAKAIANAALAPYRKGGEA